MTLKIIREHALFIFILGLCAVLRLVPLFDYQMTLDELSGLNRTRFDSFGDLIEKGVKIDAHPLLIQVFIFVTSKIFGYVNWIIKLPFLLMSLGTLVYAYLLCIKHFSKQAGIFSAIIFSFSLIFVFYAPIARMYIAGVFFSIALLYYFFEIFFGAEYKIKNYVLLTLFALLSALNHHINALFALTLCGSGLIFITKQSAKPYLLACLGAVILYLPNMPVTLYQLSIGGIGFEQNGWLPRPESTAVFTFIKVLLGTGKTYLLLLLLILVAILLNKKLLFSKKHIFLLTLFLVNYFIIYFYSVFRASVYQYSAMMFAAVAFVILISSLLEYRNIYMFYSAALILGSVLIYKTYAKKDYFNQSVKTIYEFQFERTLHYKKLYGDKNVYPVFFDADEFMQQIYFEKYRSKFDCSIASDSATMSQKLFSKLVSGLKTDYLVLASSFPAQQAYAKSYYPYLVENTQTQAINFKVYSRRKTDSAHVVPDDKILVFSNWVDNGSFSYGRKKELEKISGPLNLFIDSLSEFPFDAKAVYSDVVTKEGQMLLVKSTVKVKNTASSLVGTCISVNDKNNNEAYGYSAKDVSDYSMNAGSSINIYVDHFLGTTHTAIKDKSMITIYIWNRKKENFVLTDFEAKLIDFCPRKWQLWD